MSSYCSCSESKNPYRLEEPFLADHVAAFLEGGRKTVYDGQGPGLALALALKVRPNLFSPEIIGSFRLVLRDRGFSYAYFSSSLS